MMWISHEYLTDSAAKTQSSKMLGVRKYSPLTVLELVGKKRSAFRFLRHYALAFRSFVYRAYYEEEGEARRHWFGHTRAPGAYFRLGWVFVTRGKPCFGSS